MAQCRWHCNCKDFPQLVIRWCFHVPVSVIRLARASISTRENQFASCERGSVASTTVTPMSHQSWRAAHKVGLQPGPTLLGFHPLTGAWVPFPHGGDAQMYGLMRVVCGWDIRLEAEHASEGLSHLVSSSVTKNPFEPVTKTWHTSVLLPADTDWIKARNDTRREQRMQPGSP